MRSRRYQPRFGGKRSTRRGGFRDQFPRCLIVCGGAETEPQYFRYVAQRLRTTVELTVIGDGFAPRTAVDRAIVERQEASDEGEPYDHVWVVLDVDGRGDLINGVRDRARANDIDLIVSNPCFEVWLLWCVAEWNRPDHQANVNAAAARARIVGGAGNKHVMTDLLPGTWLQAKKRAVEARRKHADVSPFPADNPSSDVDQLVAKLIEIAQMRGDDAHGL